MKPYRMKHIDSGLYYQPCGKGGSSLTELARFTLQGKTALNAGNLMSL